MTFTAVGALGGVTGSPIGSFTLTPQGVGNYIIAEVANYQSTAVATALSSSNVTWTPLGSSFSGTGFQGSGCTAQCFIGEVTSTSGATLTITWSAGSTSTFNGIVWQEFSVTNTPVLDVQGHIDTGLGNSDWASLTPTDNNELYFGYAFNNGSVTNGSTTGYTYDSDGAGNGVAYNPNCPSGVATFPVWGDTGEAFGIMVLLTQSNPNVNISATAISATATIPTPTLIHDANVTPSVVSASVTIPTPTITRLISGQALAGDGSKAWLTDQFGQPRLYVGDECWSIIANGGEWNSGDYQSTYDTFLSQRAAQGYTGVEVSWASWNGPNTAFAFSTLQDWDGEWPFTSTSDPSSGFNETFWQRRDYFLNSAAANGITVVMNVTTPFYGTSGGTPQRSWTSTQWTDFANGLASRYASQTNLIWIVGDDYFSDSGGTLDSGLATIYTTLSAASDTHLITIQNYQETTSRLDIFTTTTKDPVPFDIHAQIEWGYSYNVSYDVVEKAQTYAPSASDDVQALVPPLWADGFFLASGVGAGQTDVRLERQMIWWALSSGAAGFQTGDNDVWPWASTSAAQITGKTFYTSVMPAIITAFSSLTNWHKLVADTSSALVTSGRGTHASAVSSGTQYTANTDSYVTASRVPDGSLAVIYCAQAFSIGIDESQVGGTGNYTATWIDPVDGTTYAATEGSSYNSGAVDGSKPISNSASDPDWVLVLQSSVTNASITASPINASTSIPSPTESAGSTVTPSVVSASTSIPAPVASSTVSIWEQSTDPLQVNSFNGTLGTVFSLSQDGNLTGIWVYSNPSATDVPAACAIYDKTSGTVVSGTENDSPTWSGVAGSGWIKCVYDGSVTLSANTDYVVSYSYGASILAAFDNFSWPVTNDIITATAGAYTTVIGLAYPSTDAGNVSYFVDVEVDPSGSTTVTPSVISATASIPGPTVSTPSNANVTPSVIAAAATIPSPSVSTGATVTPSNIAATVSFPASSFSSSVDVPAQVVSGSSSVPTPNIVNSTNVLASAVPATVSIPTPSVSAGGSANVAASVVTASVTIPAPTVDFGTTVSPSAVSATVSVPSVGVVIGTTVAASAVAASVSIPTPTVDTGSSAAVSPSAVSATVTIPVPTISASQSAVVTPSAVSVSTTVPTPAASGSSTVAPSVVALSTSLPAPTVTVSVAIQATAVSVSTAIPAPSVASQAEASVTPSVVSASVSLPAPTVSVSVAITPTAISASSSIPTPAVSTGSTVTPTVISASANIPLTTVAGSFGQSSIDGSSTSIATIGGSSTGNSSETGRS